MEHDTPARGSEKRRCAVMRRPTGTRARRGVTAVLREGRQVRWDHRSGRRVGIGTLYRRYPNREACSKPDAARLPPRASVRGNAENLNEPGLATLSSFLDCVISHADQLVLPLHGGPIPTAAETLAPGPASTGAPAHPRTRRRDGTIRGRTTLTSSS